MRVFGLVGSMTKIGNTNRIVQAVLEAAKNAAEGVETEAVQLADLKIEPCHACCEVCAKEPYKCVIEDDLQVVFEKMKRADAIVLGSALYVDVPSRLASFMERLGCLAYLGVNHNVHPLAGKPCGLVAVSYMDPTTQILIRLHQFALQMRMEPVPLKSPPFWGISGSNKMEKDAFLKPLVNAEVLGKLLVEKALRS